MGAPNQLKTKTIPTDMSSSAPIERFLNRGTPCCIKLAVQVSWNIEYPPLVEGANMDKTNCLLFFGSGWESILGRVETKGEK